MTETVSNVFDIACPNPLKLQELSSLAIVAELWRRKIRSYLENHYPLPFVMNEFFTDIVLEEVLPNMPRRIYDLLNRYVNGVDRSILIWLAEHCFKVFRKDIPEGFHYILSIFDDFALDWDGSIHEVRTAKRMMLCDRIGILKKFRIACRYCFEDDIKRIWPSVRTQIDLTKLDFQFYPDVSYWTCLLRNELHKIPNPDDEPIDEMMLYNYDCESKYNYSCASYFWNRIPLERKSLEFILELSDKNPKLFARFILPKLNEPQLEEFLAGGAEHLIRTQVIDYEREDRDLVLPIWMYVRNKIDKRIFITLIRKLLLAENETFYTYDRLKYQSKVHLCCEIWNSASQGLKQSVFDHLLPKSERFLDSRYPYGPRDATDTRFLKTVLSDASFEEMSAFWSKYWGILIEKVCVEDLLEIMKMCYRNEEEMSSFKENTMSKYENIKPCMIRMMKDYAVTELNRLLSVCVSDPQRRLELKQRFLRDPDNGVSHDLLIKEFLNDTV